MFRKLWRRHKDVLPQLVEAPIRRIQSADLLAFAIYRERARCDRSRSAFSMIVISFPKRKPARLASATEEILTARLRITDEIGWLPDGRIGVVLSDTPYAGAVKVLRDLQQQLYLEAAGWEFSIFVYPRLDSDSDDNDRDDDNLPDGPDPGNLDSLFAQPLPAWKRFADIVGAIVGIVLLSPLLLAVAAIVRLSSPGPILFTQMRHTLGGRSFRIYKFRTMRVGADAEKAKLRARSEQDGPAFKLKYDPRVTRFGRLLRVTSLDELPQLINVIRGEMSIVGPRPLPCDESAACERWQQSRLDVTPGLTCLWQVSGRSSVSFDDWMRMDRYYIRNRSLWLDIKLVVRTFGAIFRLTGK